MAKKTNDEVMNFLYMTDNDFNTKKKSEKKKRKSKKNSNVQKETHEDNIINLDNEIVIGLTPKPEQRKPKKENTNNLQAKKQKNTIKNNSNRSRVGVLDEPKQNKHKNQQKQSRKSKIRKIILKWTSILILVVGVIILFMISPIFNIKQINVEGVSKLTPEEIISYSQIQLNENTFKMHKSNVVEKIQELPYVETANITRKLPGTLEISIKERIPQYIIEIANGNAYIDSKGYILEVSQEKLQLPSLLGYETSIESIIDFKNTKKLLDQDCKKLETINKVCASARNNGILEYISAINIANSEDIILNLDTEKKIAHFGDCSYANLRVIYLKKMIEKESGIEGEAYINGNIYTMKPKPYFREKV